MKWKTTQKNNGKQPKKVVKKIKLKTTSKILQWKTTSKISKMEDDLSLRPVEDDLIFFKNRRRPKNSKMEDDFKISTITKLFSQFLSNLGANLSWGWLSSLRFFRLINFVDKK